MDTPFWENGHGHNCASYESQWCENGGARPGQEWTLGAKYHYPENNCCACGKKGKREYGYWKSTFMDTVLHENVCYDFEHQH